MNFLVTQIHISKVCQSPSSWPVFSVLFCPLSRPLLSHSGFSLWKSPEQLIFKYILNVKVKFSQVLDPLSWAEKQGLLQTCFAKYPFQITKETNELRDGSHIDLCGATLLWRSASSLLLSPTRRHLERQVEAMNQGRPQCPVGLTTLVIPLKGQSHQLDGRKGEFCYQNNAQGPMSSIEQMQGNCLMPKVVDQGELYQQDCDEFNSLKDAQARSATKKVLKGQLYLRLL